MQYFNTKMGLRDGTSVLDLGGAAYDLGQYRFAPGFDDP